ncbi:MAG: hypothetical protein AMS27_15900, partial [Bacteroides sp. SM23_62_1]
MLIELVSRSEGLSYNDAAQKVESFARNLLSEMSKNNQVIIDQIGKIMIDESGEQKFTAWKDLAEQDRIMPEDRTTPSTKKKKLKQEPEEEGGEEEAAAAEAQKKKEEEEAAAEALKKKEEEEAAAEALKKKEEEEAAVEA